MLKECRKKNFLFSHVGKQLIDTCLSKSADNYSNKSLHLHIYMYKIDD
jgi:hypothetical protein